jgi:inosine-uridine nucleoside N-ribohydrolase
VRVVPLDVTSEVRLFRHELPDFPSGPRGRLVADVLAALLDVERPVAGPCALLHDPCAVLAAADAALFRWSETVLAVEVCEGRERGRLSERPFGFGPRVHCASEAHREELCRRALASLQSFSGAPS